MLLHRTDRLPEGSKWAYELKLDGYRASAIKTAGKVHLRSRNDNDFNFVTSVPSCDHSRSMKLRCWKRSADVMKQAAWEGSRKSWTPCGRASPPSTEVTRKGKPSKPMEIRQDGKSKKPRTRSPSTTKSMTNGPAIQSWCFQPSYSAATRAQPLLLQR